MRRLPARFLRCPLLVVHREQPVGLSVQLLGSEATGWGRSGRARLDQFVLHQAMASSDPMTVPIPR